MFEFVCDALDYALNTPGNLLYEIKDWYFNGGGKELIREMFISFVEQAFVALSIVLAIYAGPIALGIAIFAGIFKVINSEAKIGARFQAFIEKGNGNARLARKYQKTDGLGDIFRLKGNEEIAFISDGITFVSDVASIFSSEPKNPREIVKYGKYLIEVPNYINKLDNFVSYIEYGCGVGNSTLNYINNPSQKNFIGVFKDGIGYPELRKLSVEFEDGMKVSELLFKTDDFDKKYDASKGFYGNE